MNIVHIRNAIQRLEAEGYIASNTHKRSFKDDTLRNLRSRTPSRRLDALHEELQERANNSNQFIREYDQLYNEREEQ
jgi:uncharacterized sporulation protein YeaH/YhbH (DUF444 family)